MADAQFGLLETRVRWRRQALRRGQFRDWACLYLTKGDLSALPKKSSAHQNGFDGVHETVRGLRLHDVSLRSCFTHFGVQELGGMSGKDQYRDGNAHLAYLRTCFEHAHAGHTDFRITRSNSCAVS